MDLDGEELDRRVAKILGIADPNDGELLEWLQERGVPQFGIAYAVSGPGRLVDLYMVVSLGTIARAKSKSIREALARLVVAVAEAEAT